MKLKKQYDCNLVMMNDLIGGKWKLRILWHIMNTAEGGRHLFHRMSVQVTKREPRKPCFEVLVSVL